MKHVHTRGTHEKKKRHKGYKIPLYFYHLLMIVICL